MRSYFISFVLRLWLPLVALLLIGCDRSAEAPTETAPTETNGEAAETITLTPEEQRYGGIHTGRLRSRALGQGLRVNGELDVPPENLVAITAPLGGFVESTGLLQGARVRRGEALAVIRNPEFATVQQQYLQAAAQLRLARADFERQQTLFKEEVAPEKNFQRARAEYESQQAAVSALAARLRLAGLPMGGTVTTTATLRAPKDGFVRAVNVSVGQSVTPTDVLFELVDPDHLHVELTVFERDAPRLEKGQLVRFTLGSDSLGQERLARVYLVARTVGPERTVRVHAHPEPEDPTLLPGTFVRALIETGRAEVPVLPDAALVRFGGRDYAFTVEKPGTYRMVGVRRGLSEDGFTQVTFAPDAGQLDAATFVTAGTYSLLAKLRNTEEEE
jgi:membrane fusion protein, heavy metal efflux system